MTRANIEIIQEYFPTKAHLVINSDGYPENVVPALVNFLVEHVNEGAIYRNKVNKTPVTEKELYGSIDSGALQNLLKETYATIGSIGNFSYAYKVDLLKGTITAWNSGTRWINAPENWEERGWSCWIGKNGKAGYTTWIKGKKVFEITLEQLLKEKQYTVEDEVRCISTTVS